MKKTTPEQAWAWVEESPGSESLVASTLFFDTWIDWVHERNRQGHPLSELAVRRQVKKSTGFTPDEVCAAIDVAIECEWRTFFPKHATPDRGTPAPPLVNWNARKSC